MAHRRISSASNEWPLPIPDTMKAAAVDRFGPPSALTVHEVPVPRPGPHEVLIAIHAAGIGSWDAYSRRLMAKAGSIAIPFGAGS